MTDPSSCKETQINSGSQNPFLWSVGALLAGRNASLHLGKAVQYHQHSICTITSARASTSVAKSSVFAGHTGARSETKGNGMNTVSSSQQAPALHFPLIYLLFQMHLWASNSNRGHRDTCLPVASLQSPTLPTQLAVTNPWEHTPHPPTYPSGATSEWLAPYYVILKYCRPERGRLRGRQSVRHIGRQHSQTPILQKIIEAVTVYLTITTR